MFDVNKPSLNKFDICSRGTYKPFIISVFHSDSWAGGHPFSLKSLGGHELQHSVFSVFLVRPCAVFQGPGYLTISIGLFLDCKKRCGIHCAIAKKYYSNMDFPTILIFLLTLHEDSQLSIYGTRCHENFRLPTARHAMDTSGSLGATGLDFTVQGEAAAGYSLIQYLVCNDSNHMSFSGRFISRFLEAFTIHTGHHNSFRKWQ